MYQLLFDHSEIHALTALYVSIYVGITLKILWAWSVEYSFMDEMANPADTKIVRPQILFYRQNSHLNGSFILRRIVKYIRRKECSQDDSEEPVSFLYI